MKHYQVQEHFDATETQHRYMFKLVRVGHEDDASAREYIFAAVTAERRAEWLAALRSVDQPRVK